MKRKNIISSSGSIFYIMSPTTLLSQHFARHVILHHVFGQLVRERTIRLIGNMQNKTHPHHNHICINKLMVSTYR